MATDKSNFLLAEAQLVLEHARKKKSEKTKDLGEPIQLTGVPLAIQIRGSYAWIAENAAVARKLDLETGRTVQLYKGHTAPVTTLAFCDKIYGSGDGKILITGSWDKTIKLWDTETKELISSTDAHDDFVKSLFVFPSIQLLVSGSSDKIVRFWDLSAPTQSKPLTSVGSISSHTRPVECLEGKLTNSIATLYTGDTMGLIKVWTLVQEPTSPPRWRGILKGELNHHRTRINEMLHGEDQLWTASADETVQMLFDSTEVPDPEKKNPPPIAHPMAVRAILPLPLTDLSEPYVLTGAGDIIRLYNVATLDEPELIGTIDAHWHDVTALRLWSRKFIGDDKVTRIEPWIVSASLDGTIRKWKLNDLLNPPPQVPEEKPTNISSSAENNFALTEEEERELAELLDSD